MIRITEQNWQTYCEKRLDEDGEFQARPRRSIYGAPDTIYGYGLIPMADYPSKLIQPADYKDAIADAHAAKRFPMYHKRNSWKKRMPRWNQNGLPYCWAWGACGRWMTARGSENVEGDKPPIILAPNTLGWLVGWREKGFFLDATIKGMRERGAASIEFVPNIHSINPSSFKDGWEQDALLHRFSGDIYDTDMRSQSLRAQHCITLLCAGIDLYIAYNWWGHALGCSGLMWNDRTNKVDWIDDNSHNEDDFIIVEGTRGIPDEAYGVPSTDFSMAV